MKTTWSKPDSVSSVNITPDGAEIAAHHPLHARRKRDVPMRESLMHPIGNGPIVVQAGKYLSNGMKNIIQAIDVEECFLLACERGLREVLGRGRRAHRPRRVGRPVGKRPERFGDFGTERGGQRRVRDPAADFRPGLRQRRDIVDVERCEPRRDARVETVVREELAKRKRRRGESAGHADSRAMELADHLAKRGVLAADLIDIRHPHAVEGNYSLGCDSSLNVGPRRRRRCARVASRSLQWKVRILSRLASDS